MMQSQPDVDEDQDDIDGCDVESHDSDATPDEDLPEAVGGAPARLVNGSDFRSPNRIVMGQLEMTALHRYYSFHRCRSEDAQHICERIPDVSRD